MKTRKQVLRIIAVILMIVITTFVSGTAVLAKDGDSQHNRFNVMLVLDASGSMNNTDANECRFDALTQFIGLLAEKGNVVGGLVFSTEILATKTPKEITCQEDKDELIDMLKSVKPKGYTNTGAALTEAVDLLAANGDPDLPYVIIYLSDGTTEMPDAEALELSLEQKADAIQNAREKAISIYSICLNQNGEADAAEMAQISSATGGESSEVTDPEDLEDAFLMFYNLIYGTSAITIVDEKFPANGRIETEFDIPGIGVEEVNIVVYGETTHIEVLDPTGNVSNASIQIFDTFSLIKMTEFVPGKWKLVTEGDPDNHIKINMVYNTNLDVGVKATPESNTISPDEELSIAATLSAGGVLAADIAQYTGYSAKLCILDAYGNELDSVPMSMNDNHFGVKYKFTEGTYHYYVLVTGNYIETASQIIGPLTVQETVIPNTTPTPISEKIEKTVNIWPFKGGSYSVDINTLATDAEDSSLHYDIISSSFVEGDDYSVDTNNILTLNNFSLSKGSFLIRATDSGGLSCDIEILIKTRNIGIISLVVAGVVLLAIAIFIWIAARIPWSGTLIVTKINDAYDSGRPRGSFRGKIKLSSFMVGNCGLDQNKCYFRARRGNQLEFCSKTPVFTDDSEKATRVSIYGGTTRIYADENKQQGIRITIKNQK